MHMNVFITYADGAALTTIVGRINPMRASKHAHNKVAAIRPYATEGVEALDADEWAGWEDAERFDLLCWSLGWERDPDGEPILPILSLN